MQIAKLIDSALISLKQKPLDKNSDFVFDSEWNYNYYTRVYLEKSNNIFIMFEITSDGLAIHIDRTKETYDWGYKFIRKNEEYIIDVIKTIFSTKIQIEYCGKHYTKIYFLNNKGDIINSFTYITSLFGFRWNCIFNRMIKIYNPIYKLGNRITK